MDKQYWASETEPQKLLQGLNKVKENCWQTLEARGLPSLWRLIIRELEGHRGQGSLEKGLTYNTEKGKSDEIRFRVNLIQAASLQKAQLAQGKNKTKFKCLSVNGDASTMAKQILAQKAMDYVFRTIRLDEEGIRGLLHDINYGAAAFWIRWNVDAGEKVNQERAAIDASGQPIVLPAITDPNTGAVVQPPQPQMETVKVKTGTPVVQALPPTAVMRDYSVKESLWYIVQEPISRWELVAQYPEMADRLLNAREGSKSQQLAMAGWNISSWTDDTIILNHFYHADTKAVPGGRWVGWVDDILLWDTPQPTSDVPPVVWMCSHYIAGTYLPYPEVSDMLAPQIALNESFTLVVEELMRHNRANMAVKKGSIYDTDALSKGGAVIEVEDMKADLPVFLTKPPIGQAPALLIETLPKLLQQIGGLNDVSAGNPDSNITSGTYAALMVNRAEDNQGIRGDAHVSTQERVGNIVLDLMTKNIPNGFLVDISGAIDAPYLQVVGQDTFSGIHKIQVVRDTKIAESWPARMEMAQMLFQIEKPDDRAACVEMMTTGNLEPITRRYTAQQTLIAQENEKLLGGDVMLQAAITDDPHMHIMEHIPTLNMIRMMPPGPARNQALLAATLHISRHGAAFGGCDPVMLQLLGLPMPALPGAPAEAQKLSGDEPESPQEHKSEGAKGEANEARPINITQPQETGNPRLPSAAQPPQQLNDTLK